LWGSRWALRMWMWTWRDLRCWKSLPDKRWRYSRLRRLSVCCSELQSVWISDSAIISCMICKYSINPVTTPNPIYSHTLSHDSMNSEDGFCLSKTWKPLLSSLKDHRKPPLRHIGPCTLPLSGHHLFPLRFPINPKPFLPSSAFLRSFCSSYPEVQAYNPQIFSNLPRFRARHKHLRLTSWMFPYLYLPLKRPNMGTLLLSLVD
jgi:hypothetical protein